MNLTKKELRQRIRILKQSLTEEEILHRSEQLCHMVLQNDAYRNAKTIYGYLPFNQEVRTQLLLARALADGKHVALPKCVGKEMFFVLVTDLTRVHSGSIGAPEPIDCAPIAREKDALVLVPGIVFDHRGHRIGYGGGYYDRFLAAEPEHPTIALCYDFQLVPRLDADPHDIPVDTVLSV